VGPAVPWKGRAPAADVAPYDVSRFGPEAPDVPVGSSRIRALYVYPLKSAAGIPVETVEVDRVGLRFDRHWMVVDAGGRFMSQRTHPNMALLDTELAGGTLRVDLRGRASPVPTLELPLEDGVSDADLVRVRVWFEDRYGVDCGEDAAAWMSEALGAPCRVLCATPPPDGGHLSAEGRVRAGFADARPALVISTASLEDLNARLRGGRSPPLPMNRFRPNIVVDGTAPYEEDTWDVVRMGSVSVRGVHPCPRCATTTVDQSTGTLAGPEPLRTLSTYRRTEDGGAAFGMNVAFDGPGVLRVGDGISV
jgi:uncharacterized protein YcbX